MGAATDVGRVREANEDGFLVDDAIGLVALADGMGGHLGGEVASATALEALRAAVRGGRPLRDAVLQANEAVFTKSLTDSTLTGMGTTLTAGTMAAGGTLILAHVGDSRAYLLRDGTLRRITTDHSHVQELVDDGRLTHDEAAVHPMRNIVTRALGVEASVEVDVYPLQLEVDDRVVLCSDGLTDMVHEDAIAAELRRDPDPVMAARKLVDAANAAGGVDNITVVVVAVTGEDAPGGAPTPVLEVAGAPGAEPPAEARVVDEPEPDGATRDREPPSPGARGRAVRTALWVLAVVLVLAVAAGTIAWYARRSYYVGFRAGEVTVYKGVPGGLAWWDPTVERHTGLTRDDLRPAEASAVADEKAFASLGDANAFVRRIRARSQPSPAGTTTPRTGAAGTTTTGPPAGTTAAPGTTPPGTPTTVAGP